jgi:hypothetical protein
VKLCEDFTQYFGDKRTGYCIKATHRLTFTFSPWDFFYYKHDCRHPPDFSLFPLLKIKLKGRHFDTTEVIEAESQVVLNTTSRMFFKNGRSVVNGV